MNYEDLLKAFEEGKLNESAFYGLANVLGNGLAKKGKQEITVEEKKSEEKKKEAEEWIQHKTFEQEKGDGFDDDFKNSLNLKTKIGDNFNEGKTDEGKTDEGKTDEGKTDEGNVVDNNNSVNEQTQSALNKLKEPFKKSVSSISKVKSNLSEKLKASSKGAKTAVALAVIAGAVDLIIAAPHLVATGAFGGLGAKAYSDFNKGRK